MHATPLSMFLRLAARNAPAAPTCVLPTVSLAKSSTFIGLGAGQIRTGLDAIHRVEVPKPEFLAEPQTVAVVGAPMTYGQPFDGVQLGPTALREAGLLDAILKLGWRVKEHGNIDFDDIPRGKRSRGDQTQADDLPLNCRHPHLVGASNERIYKAAKQHAGNGRFVLTIGGDHSIACGTIAGILAARPDVGVIWVDAHADINTPLTSGSGNMHGMPLGLLTPLFADFRTKLPGHQWLADVPILDFNRLVYIGLRDLDKPERTTIINNNIKAFTMSHVDRYGIGKVMEMALDHLGNRPLHLSYDIDACDPVIAPSTGTAVRGGLSYREAHYIAEACAETEMLGSMDLVEVNPTLKGEEAFGISLGEETVELGLAIAASALGNRIL